MNYTSIYYSIINNRKNNQYNGYTERHHILPRSLGGTDDKDNLVNLSAREHFICHLLLTKIYQKGTNEYYKMIHAYIMMCNVKSKNHMRNYNVNSRLYDNLKTDYSESMKITQSGKNNNQYGTMWIYSNTLRESKKVKKDYVLDSDWCKGRVMNFEYLDRKCIKCDVNLGCISSKELRKNCTECSKKRSDDTKKKIKLNNSCKKCICDGIEYISVGEASRHLNLNAETIRMRIKSKNFCNYYV